MAPNEPIGGRAAASRSQAVLVQQVAIHIRPAAQRRECRGLPSASRRAETCAWPTLFVGGMNSRLPQLAGDTHRSWSRVALYSFVPAARSPWCGAAPQA